VLDDDAGRRALGIEFGDAFVGRVGVVDVVVGELFALHLPRGGDAGAQIAGAIERRRLMRILAVAQRFDQVAADRAEGGRGIRELIREPIGDRGVIDAGAGIGLGGELAPQRERRRAAVLPDLASTTAFSRGVIGPSTATSAWFLAAARIMAGTADVDVLDAGFESAPLAMVASNG